MLACVHVCMHVDWRWGVSPGAGSSEGKGPGTGAKELAVISPLHPLTSTAVAFPGWQERFPKSTAMRAADGAVCLKLKPGWSDPSMPTPQ